ncbi:hypothetical protein NDU88_000944 [Pleurodeles waltl]|uniref:Uncharacterized protein n=1 Tax=Pleurodeles waltl TaxID=8319 RepID=A0AAV7R762_PLEWA|nr:hypothetical protein NDU88_000944 [Pleurodeles waltl]
MCSKEETVRSDSTKGIGTSRGRTAEKCSGCNSGERRAIRSGKEGEDARRRNTKTATHPSSQHPGGGTGGSKASRPATLGRAWPCQEASPIEGGIFKPISGRVQERRPSAATAPAETSHREAQQRRSAADSTAVNYVPYEAAKKEKTPVPGEGTRRRRPTPCPSVQVEEQEAARPADQPRSGESVALPGKVLI